MSAFIALINLWSYSLILVFRKSFLWVISGLVIASQCKALHSLPPNLKSAEYEKS